MPRATTEPKARGYALRKGARGAVSREDDFLEEICALFSVVIALAAENAKWVAALHEEMSRPPAPGLFPWVGSFPFVILGRPS